MDDAPIQLAVPAAVLERYDLHERIHDGPWSHVFRGDERALGAPRALKILKPEHADIARVRSRFLAEARAMARIVHPHVVRIFDVGLATGDAPVIVMEYAAGGDLGRYVPTDEGLAPATAARIALQVLDGLGAAHAAELVHRDVQPASILLDGEGRAKLCDFGAVRFEQPQRTMMTMTGEALGDFMYTAPEQRVRAASAGVQADLYGVGATLYFMLRGRTPPDLSLLSLNPAILDSIAEPLRGVITTATEPSPSQRFPSAHAMASALQAALDTLVAPR